MIVGVVALLVALLHFFAPDALTLIATPAWKVGDALSSGIEHATAPFGNAVALARDRDRLIAENMAANEENRMLRAKTTDLERLLGGRAAAPESILAGVLARPPVSSYDTLVVDAGSSRGVTQGAYAYGPGGTPLGTVDSVSERSSRIFLFSAGGRTIDGWVGEKRIPVTLTGKGAGAFIATMPRESQVAVNDVVYVPGPGALPIGTVVRVDADPSSPSMALRIAPYTNLFSLTWVTIGR